MPVAGMPLKCVSLTSKICSLSLISLSPRREKEDDGEEVLVGKPLVRGGGRR
ncbi:hypothetical protein Hanom_Chr09g00815431 [Helianthus anomalus]